MIDSTPMRNVDAWTGVLEAIGSAAVTAAAQQTVNKQTSIHVVNREERMAGT
jgi:hypothetical protein